MSDNARVVSVEWAKPTATSAEFCSASALM